MVTGNQSQSELNHRRRHTQVICEWGCFFTLEISRSQQQQQQKAGVCRRAVFVGSERALSTDLDAAVYSLFLRCDELLCCESARVCWTIERRASGL